MELKRRVRRYTAYFRGWSQAFGEHDPSFAEDCEVSWLLAPDQVGLILPDEVRKVFYLELLGKKTTIKTLRVSQTQVEFGRSSYPLEERRDIEGVGALMTLLRREEPTHLYLTYHLLYPQGTRIVTFSKKTPLPIIYKEMQPLTVVVE